MKLETFLEKFDRFADAPGAVEKMRELVLGLAVRGRLVKQSPSEGDAASLLETLLDARNKGELRKSINEPGTVALTEVEGWHQVPASWRWVRLEAVGEIVGGGTPDPTTQPSLPRKESHGSRQRISTDSRGRGSLGVDGASPRPGLRQAPHDFFLLGLFSSPAVRRSATSRLLASHWRPIKASSPVFRSSRI